MRSHFVWDFPGCRFVRVPEEGPAQLRQVFPTPAGQRRHVGRHADSHRCQVVLEVSCRSPMQKGNGMVTLLPD